jgi:hypothetical protein
MNRSQCVSRWVSVPVRLRWSLWAVLAFVAAVLARADDPPDLLSFGERGAAILNGHLSQVYLGSWNQAGPAQLIGARLLLLGSSTDRPLFGVELAVDFALLALLRLVCRRSRASAGVEFVLAGVAVVWLGPAGLWSGHPVEVAIPVLWLVAARYAIRGRWLIVGLLLGLAALVAPWAMVAAPIAFVGRTGAIRAISLAIVVALSGYLPFLISGQFGMFSHTWPINSHTLVHLLAPGLTEFNWSLRLLQAGVAAGGCFAAVRWLRGRVDAQWAAPLVAVLLRILLDPVLLSYYWLPAGLLVIAGGALRCTVTRPLPRRRVTVALIALGYLTYLGAAGVAPVLTCLACLVATAVAVTPARNQSLVSMSSRPMAYRRASAR